MKRETRIGLGLGLLFILAFGLILSEVTNSNSPPQEQAIGDDDTEYLATSRADQSGMLIGEAVTRPPPANSTVRRAASAVAERPPEPPQREAQPQRDREIEAANVMLAATVRQEQGDGPPRPISGYREMDAQELEAYVRGSAAQAATQTYVVKTGDTLTGIARRFMGDGSWASVEKLFEMNRHVLTDPDRLDIGMQLTVPARPGRNN